MQPTDFEPILKVLAAHEVDLVVVGGVAATLQGAPITTFDLDIVHSREEANLDRLMAALRGLDARYREKPDLRIAPDRERLGGPGHHLLMTRAGPLDVLGAVVTGEGYTELAATGQTAWLVGQSVAACLEHVQTACETLRASFGRKNLDEILQAAKA